MWLCVSVVQASSREEKKLMVENAKLKSEIEELKRILLEKEKKTGGMCRVYLFTNSNVSLYIFFCADVCLMHESSDNVSTLYSISQSSINNAVFVCVFF